MTTRNERLANRSILVLEDDYHLATDLQQALEACGATVIGPFGDETEAVRALNAGRPDCAFVDVNLGAGPSFTAPRALLGSAVPFVFVTGYDAGTIPLEFVEVPRLEKPAGAKEIVEAAARLLQLETLPG